MTGNISPSQTCANYYLYHTSASIGQGVVTPIPAVQPVTQWGQDLIKRSKQKSRPGQVVKRNFSRSKCSLGVASLSSQSVQRSHNLGGWWPNFRPKGQESRQIFR